MIEEKVYFMSIIAGFMRVGNYLTFRDHSWGFWKGEDSLYYQWATDEIKIVKLYNDDRGNHCSGYYFKLLLSRVMVFTTAWTSSVVAPYLLTWKPEFTSIIKRCLWNRAVGWDSTCFSTCEQSESDSPPLIFSLSLRIQLSN